MTWLWHAAAALVGMLLLVSLTFTVVAFTAARRYFKKVSTPAIPAPAPKVSILKPVEGAGPETYEAFASFCRIDYPGEVELLIGTVKSDDPVVAVVRRLQQEFSGRNIRLVFADLQGANRKTSIMEALWRKASGQYLFFSDADIFAPADYLKQLVPLLTEQGVGCLTCLPRGVKADTIGGKMIALHYGFNFLTQWMLALKTTGIHWAVGHTMAVPRSVLEKLGGFHQFLNHLADDYELGHRVSDMGLRVVVPPLLLDCAMPSESFAGALRRMLRWKRTIRRSRGLQSLGVIVTYPVFWAVILAAINPFAWWSCGALGLTLTLRWLLAGGLQSVIKLPDWSRAWWLLPVVDLVEGVTFIGAYFGSTICWAGRRYCLHEDGTLELMTAESRAAKASSPEKTAPQIN